MVEYPTVPKVIMLKSRNRDIRNFTNSIRIQVGQGGLSVCVVSSGSRAWSEDTATAATVWDYSSFEAAPLEVNNEKAAGVSTCGILNASLSDGNRIMRQGRWRRTTSKDSLGGRYGVADSGHAGRHALVLAGMPGSDPGNIGCAGELPVAVSGLRPADDPVTLKPRPGPAASLQRPISAVPAPSK